MFTKEALIHLLATNDKAVERAIMVLYERQTTSEQAAHASLTRNNRGFMQCHAAVGTSMAKAYLRYGSLTQNKINYWRRLDSKGKMKIARYWSQLLEAAKEKALQKEAA